MQKWNEIRQKFYERFSNTVVAIKVGFYKFIFDNPTLYHLEVYKSFVDIMNRLKCDIISQVFLKFDLTSSVSFYIEVLIDRTLDCAAKYVCFEGNVNIL
ncbi:hypothetical protein [Ehrlichia muris]|uniref:hypothetical protein n=1 Tax=Ehrlichia muris TaxID=35795 RepID=UPI0037BFCCA2